MTTEELVVVELLRSDFSLLGVVIGAEQEAARGLAATGPAELLLQPAASCWSLDTLDLRLIISLESQGGLSPNQLTSWLTVVVLNLEEDPLTPDPLDPSSAEDEAESLDDDREKLEVRDPHTTPESFLMDSSLGLGMGTTLGVCSSPQW